MKLHDEIEQNSSYVANTEAGELKRLLGRIDELKVLFKQTEGFVFAEGKRNQQVKENLEAEADALRAALHTKELMLRSTERARGEVEQSLNAKIHDLESELQATRDLVHGQKVQLLEKDHLLETAEQEMQLLREQMTAEIDRLTSELHEKKVRLAVIERDVWRSNGRWKFWTAK